MKNKGSVSLETLEFFGAWIVIIIACIWYFYYSKYNTEKKEAAEHQAYVEAYDAGYEDGYNHDDKDYDY